MIFKLCGVFKHPSDAKSTTPLFLSSDSPPAGVSDRTAAFRNPRDRELPANWIVREHDAILRCGRSRSSEAFCQFLDLMIV